MKLKLFYGTLGGAGLLEKSIDTFGELNNIIDITTSMSGTSIMCAVTYTEKKAAPSRAKKK